MGSMKAKKVVKAMTRSDLVGALVAKTGVDKKAVNGCLSALTDLATAEVKKTGKFTIHGLCMLQTRIRPARKAGKSMAFGKVITVKARPATKIVKAYPVSALKQHLKSFCRSDLKFLICEGV